jgi:hypothetical protein
MKIGFTRNYFFAVLFFRFVNAVWKISLKTSPETSLETTLKAANLINQF